MDVNITELILGAILGVIFALILTPLAEDKIQDLLVRVFGTSQRKSQRLAGKWLQRWWVESTQYSLTNEDVEAIVKQLGKRISAKYKASDQDGRVRVYILKGVIENNYITGTWHDLEKGVTYFGAFQLCINTNADTLEGIWIGFSGKSSKIKSGKWEWKRPDVQSYPSDKKSVFPAEN